MAINIMKKLNIALALILLIPFAAIALTPEDEVTIRVMEMHEKSSSSVMDRIELPDAATDQVAEETNDRKRLIEHKGDGEGEGAGEYTGEGIGEMDQDLTYNLEQIQNQDQDREEMQQETVQDQIRDSLGSEQPGKNPKRSGPEG